MRLDITDLIHIIINSSNAERLKLLENYSRVKVADSFLTVEEVLVMYMYYVEGRRPDEISRILGKSRSNIYATLQRAKGKLLYAGKTVIQVNAFRNAVKVMIYRNEDVDDVIKKIYNKADAKNVKLPYKSYELKDKLRSLGIIDDDDRVIDDMELIILPEIGIFGSGRGIEEA